MNFRKQQTIKNLPSWQRMTRELRADVMVGCFANSHIDAYDVIRGKDGVP